MNASHYPFDLEFVQLNFSTNKFQKKIPMKCKSHFPLFLESGLYKKRQFSLKDSFEADLKHLLP